MREHEGNLRGLLGGLQLKTRVQHPEIHERTDRGNPYWFFRYWIDIPQPDGSLKPMRKIKIVGPSKGPHRVTKKDAEVQRDKFLATINGATAEDLWARAWRCSAQWPRGSRSRTPTLRWPDAS